jgi:hypothetical protein
MKKFLSVASTAVLCLAVVPASADTTLMDDVGGFDTISGFARIDSKGCAAKWNKNSSANGPGQNFYVSCTPTFQSTTDDSLILGSAQRDLNDTVEDLKDAGDWVYSGPNPGAEYLSGSWGITVNFHPGQLSDVVTGQDRVSNCVFHATPMSVVGSAYVADNEAGMTTAIGQRSNGREIMIAFFKDGRPVPSAPNDISLSWSCIIPESEPETVTVDSNPLSYGPTGWGGWSCPSDTTVVDCNVNGASVAEVVQWKPGASTSGGVDYPNTPFGYTYPTGETGCIVQNDDDSETITITLTCEEVDE